jgi:hypothetical protein
MSRPFLLFVAVYKDDRKLLMLCDCMKYMLVPVPFQADVFTVCVDAKFTLDVLLCFWNTYPLRFEFRPEKSNFVRILPISVGTRK